MMQRKFLPATQILPGDILYKHTRRPVETVSTDARGNVALRFAGRNIDSVYSLTQKFHIARQVVA